MKAALIKLVSVITLLSIALSACKPRSEPSPAPEIQAATSPAAIKVFINGEPLDLGETGNLLPNMPSAPIGSGQYTCADNTFTYWPPVSGFTVSPIIFTRVW